MYLFSIYLFFKLLIYIKIDSCMFIYILGYNIAQGYVLHFNSLQPQSLGALSVSSCIIIMFSQKKKKNPTSLLYGTTKYKINCMFWVQESTQVTEPETMCVY